MSVTPLLQKVRSKVRNRLAALIKAYGGSALKKRVWDYEFAKGSWEFIDQTPGDYIYPFIEKYSRGGSILDLGCGSGNTANEVQAGCYRKYVGVDISDVAVQKAINRSAANGRSANAYFQGDICTYQPSETFDVILFRESIWYIPFPQLRAQLDRYRQYLSPCGVIIVRFYEKRKFEAITSLINNHYHILEEHVFDRDYIMIFR
ncbi:MAG TPA: class I SAM-dependent methyltransferase [Verrucomicrobiae bacterium]